MNNKFANNNNNTSALGQFLNKAQMGMQMSSGPQRDITDAILDELTLDSDLDFMAENISREFGINYESALEEIKNVVDGMYNMNVEDVSLEDEYFEEEETPIKPTYDYGFDEPSAADDMYYPDDTGFEDEDDLAIEDERALSLQRKGGTISKKKFVKDTLRKLKKASEGMEQSESNIGDIRDTPIGGRQSKVNNFRRGIKDLGNEHYAKDIYDKTMQLQQQVSGLSPMAQEGVEVNNMNMQETDIENPMHHLQAYSSALSNIFKQPMNQVHGPGYEMPMARKGREQRAADRETRQANKDWQKMFGDIAVGYIGVPGMPNYLQMISPNVMSGQASPEQATQMNVPGPLVNMSFKKGPWWSGKREWTAEGIPAEMFMGMGMGMGRGMGTNYGSGYVPQTTTYDTRRQYPGEVIRSTTTKPVTPGVTPIVPASTNAVVPESNIPVVNDPVVTTPNVTPVINPTAEQVEAVRAQIPRFDELSDVVKAQLIDYHIKSGRNPQDILIAMNENITQDVLNSMSHEELVNYYNERNKDLSSEEMAPWDYRLNDIIERFTDEDTPDYTNYYPSLLQSAMEKYGSKFQSGGTVNNPFSDEYGNLQRFVYGGNEMPDSPILEYEDDYMSSKDVDDPFMFKKGGLYKYQGTGNSQVNDICTHTNCFPQGNSGQNSNDYNNWLKRKVEKEALVEYNEWMNRNAQGNQNMTSYNANLNDPVYQQILQRRMAGLTGQPGEPNKNTQLRGQTPQLRGQYPTAPSVGQQIRGMFSPFQRNPQTGRNYDFMWASQAGPARTADGQIFQPGVNAGQPFTQAQMDPTKPGYRYDYKYEKGPWWSGKRTLSVTGKWIDPTNPNAGTAPSPSVTPESAVPTTNTSIEPGATIPEQNITPAQYMQSQLTLPEKDFDASWQNTIQNTAGPTVDKPYMAFGGYIPEYNDLYRFQGPGDSEVNPENTNAFDPNINNQTASQCSDSEKMDPNSMCYDPSFRPQDFTATYNLKKARTLDTGNIANIMGAAGVGIQEASRAFDNRYQDQYLRDRTTSDNMAFTNNLDYRGGYSGLTQRSVGAPTFTGVVGNASFVKKGGQIKYKEGGVYDLDQNEIGRILAAGGKIEFI
jgi:hypothetical protein